MHYYASFRRAFQLFAAKLKAADDVSFQLASYATARCCHAAMLQPARLSDG